MKTKNTENVYQVPAFARGLKVIELLSEHPSGLSMTEMDTLSLPPATLFRMLNTLLDTGYAVRDQRNIYRLSSKLFAIAGRTVGNTALTTAAEEPMKELRDGTGETVLLAVLQGGEGVVIHQEPSNRAVKVILEVGHRFPLHSAAPAKAILANLPPKQRDEMIEKIEFKPFTPHTITNEKAFREELAEIRKSGVAFDRGEELEELRCVAAPIFDYQENPVAAVWVSGPASRFHDKLLLPIAAQVKATARQITDQWNRKGN